MKTLYFDKVYNLYGLCSFFTKSGQWPIPLSNFKWACKFTNKSLFSLWLTKWSWQLVIHEREKEFISMNCFFLSQRACWKHLCYSRSCEVVVREMVKNLMMDFTHAIPHGNGPLSKAEKENYCYALISTKSNTFSSVTCEILKIRAPTWETARAS